MENLNNTVFIFKHHVEVLSYADTVQANPRLLEISEVIFTYDVQSNLFHPRPNNYSKLHHFPLLLHFERTKLI